jgi:hypothetical protein
MLDKEVFKMLFKMMDAGNASLTRWNWMTLNALTKNNAG